MSKRPRPNASDAAVSAVSASAPSGAASEQSLAPPPKAKRQKVAQAKRHRTKREKAPRNAVADCQAVCRDLMSRITSAPAEEMRAMAAALQQCGEDARQYEHLCCNGFEPVLKRIGLTDGISVAVRNTLRSAGRIHRFDLVLDPEPVAAEHQAVGVRIEYERARAGRWLAVRLHRIGGGRAHRLLDDAAVDLLGRGGVAAHEHYLRGFDLFRCALRLPRSPALLNRHIRDALIGSDLRKQELQQNVPGDVLIVYDSV